MPKSKFKIDEITLVLIVAIIAIFVSIYHKSSQPPGMEAKKITEVLTDDHGISFASNGIVDANKLAEIRNINYADLRKSINAKDDFCIYIEDGDGNVILAKGSPKLSRDGLSCRE